VHAVLALIWTASLALAAGAFAALGVLLIARIRRERIERANPDRRRRISRQLLRYAGSGGEAPVFAVRQRVEREILIETALDIAPLMRGAARERLVQLLREAGLDDRLRKQARGGSVRARLAALEGLELFPGAETLAVLERTEQSRDLRIWLTALRTRAALGAGPTMAELLALSERPGARRSPIMHDLVAARAKERFAEALETLRTPLAPLTRAVLVRALGETGKAEGLEPLRIALHNPDPAVRSAAAGALGELGLDAAGDALARAAGDVDWRVRLKASEAIGRLGLSRHAGALRALLNDPVWWVRFRAEEALKRLGTLAPSPAGATPSRRSRVGARR
jgi:hypothetical protein